MQGNYCAKLGNYKELLPGDAILKPDQHVEMFIRWSDDKKENFIEAGCHNSQENCSHREVPISNYVGNGYFGCRPHANYVCGGSLKGDKDTNTTNVLLVPSLKEKKQIKYKLGRGRERERERERANRYEEKISLAR